MKKFTTNRGILLYIILSIVTFTIYIWYVDAKMAAETNEICKEDGKHTTGTLLKVIFFIITFGIYGIVWQYKFAERRADFLVKYGKNKVYSGGSYILWNFILSWTVIGYYVAKAKTLHQQNAVNKVYNDSIGQ